MVRSLIVLHGAGNEVEGNSRNEECDRPRKRKPICAQIRLSFLRPSPGIRVGAQLASQLSRTDSDTWLLSAEISVASAAGLTSRHIKRAQSLLTSGGVSAEQTTELASALGTVELGSNTRNAKRRFRTALEQPNDNSLAQAGWASLNFGLFDVASDLSARTALAYEQQAWQHYLAGNWGDALTSALGWREDQPFRAARLFSHPSFGCRFGGLRGRFGNLASKP